VHEVRIGSGVRRPLHALWQQRDQMCLGKGSWSSEGKRQMTGRRLSPIEMMIDEATGFKPSGNPKPLPITLRCPLCKRTKSAPIDPTDPSGTAVVECVCDKCDHGGLKPETHYYDAKGRWFNGDKFVRAKAPS
jgi:hypothetical protein